MSVSFLAKRRLGKKRTDQILRSSEKQNRVSGLFPLSVFFENFHILREVQP